MRGPIRWQPIFVAGIVMLCHCARSAAEEIEPLPAGFMEFLASFGADDDDWLLFVDEPPKKASKPAAEAPVSPAGEKASPAKPASKDGKP
jgi:hypothetical protein